MVHRGQRVASITQQRLWGRDARAQKHHVDAQTGASPDGGMQQGLAGTQLLPEARCITFLLASSLPKLAAVKETQALRLI